MIAKEVVGSNIYFSLNDMTGSELRNYVANVHASYQGQAIRLALSWAVCLFAVFLQIRGRVTYGRSMIIRNVASCNSFF